MLSVKMLLSGGPLSQYLKIDRTKSVLRSVWHNQVLFLDKLLGGRTDADDEARVAGVLLGAASADQLAALIEGASSVILAGWGVLDDELESATVTQISARLAHLFDRRDYLPWRMTDGAFADHISPYDRGAARFLLEVVARDRWRTLVADLALREARAQDIGNTGRLAEADRAALDELERSANRLSGDDADGVRGLFAMCDAIDRSFRATAFADTGTLLDTVDRIASSHDAASRNGGLDGLAFLRDSTVAAYLIVAQRLGLGDSEAAIMRIRRVLEAAVSVPRHDDPNALEAALAALRREIDDVKQDLNSVTISLAHIGDRLAELRVIGSGADETALSTLDAVRAAGVTSWLPSAWKVQLCDTLLLVDATGDDDEQMILHVLGESRTPAEFFHLHSSLGQENLESNIDGAENDQFYDLLDRFTKK